MSSHQSFRNASTPYLAKASQATAVVVVNYFLYWIYQLYQCGETPISKEDVMLRQAILAHFPADYEVKIEGADLLSSSGKSLVAYDNRCFVGKAFAMDDQVIKRLERDQGRINLPSVKVFYIAEPGLLFLLLNLSPSLNTQENTVELSLREYRKAQLAPFNPDAKWRPREQFEIDYAFLQLFNLNQLEVAGYDGDGRDEPCLGYLSYAGGSGRTRWSVIYDLGSDALTAHSGYPEMLDIDVARFIQVVDLHASLDGILSCDQHQLGDVAGRGSERFALAAAERQTLIANPPQRDDYARVLMNLSPRSPYTPDRFIGLDDGSRLSLAPCHTNNYSTFLDIGRKKTLVEAPYIDDDACHWREHRWRMMAFHYDNGRWISDRTINSDGFSGQRLRDAGPLGPDGVFGTYRDQGPAGLVQSFIDSRWTASSRHSLDDPLGVGMRTLSPVKQQVKERYREN